MENQDSCSTHHSVMSDHRQEVDGVIYRELKTLNHVVIQDGPHAGMDEQVLVHTRSIGDLTYPVNYGQAVRYADWCEDAAFQEEWDKNWNPPWEGSRSGNQTSQESPWEGSLDYYSRKC